MESLSTIAQNPLFSHAFVLIGVLVAACYFWWRAGSIYSMLDRLWRLVAGKTDVHDPVLKSLLQESRDIEKFIFTYRLKVRTVADIHRLQTWLKTHEIGISQLQKIRRWVDFKVAELVSPPPRNFAITRIVFGCVAVFVAICISPVSTSHNAYLQMRVSKVWFKTDGITVQAPFERWSFDSAACSESRANLMQLTGFNAVEADAICSAFKDGSLKGLIKETVRWQMGLGLVGVLIAIALACAGFMDAHIALEAQRLREQVYPNGANENIPVVEKDIV